MTETVVTDKHILLGVTGSIAAYKAPALASDLTKLGANVDVIMTESAERFVSPLTFQALTARPVYTSLWKAGSGTGMGAHIAHVGLGHTADLLLIAPITANMMAKLAHGLADDLLSVTALAARCPILIAPAMDVGMYSADATQANIETLQQRGIYFAGPTTGRMASGLEGLGRMVEPEEVAGHVRQVLGRNGDLAGRRVVVSAGPTREAIDPVRFISNRSSGKQGFAIAQAAVDAGAQVTLISGPVALPAPVGVQRVDVISAQEMADAVLAHATGDQKADVLIMAAAVSDFRPAERAADKIKKAETDDLQLSLVRNPDILRAVVRATHRPTVLVGFAAESEDLIANAQAKLARKKLDLIVANDISAADAGFEVNTNRVHFITPAGSEQLPLLGKDAVATRIVRWVANRLTGDAT